MTEMRIRAATLQDLDAAVQLFARLNELESEWRVFDPGPDLLAKTARRYARLIRSPEGIVVVTETGGWLVGLGAGEVTTPSSYSDERALELSNLFVEPTYRRRGIGRAMVSEVVALARDLGVHRLVLKVFASNEDAMRFWSHLGFRARLTQFTALTSEVSAALDEPRARP